MPENDRSRPAASTRPPRKRYTKPRLQEYGHVAKLTQSGGSTKSEGGNPMAKGCL
jgi:hypothetical protein